MSAMIDVLIDHATAEIKNLKEDNKALRDCLLRTVHEKKVLEDCIARQSAYILELKKRAGIAPHDWEPARPGIEDVD